VEEVGAGLLLAALSNLDTKSGLMMSAPGAKRTSAERGAVSIDLNSDREGLKQSQIAVLIVSDLPR
jgi:hypothetical protein